MADESVPAAEQSLGDKLREVAGRDAKGKGIWENHVLPLAAEADALIVRIEHEQLAVRVVGSYNKQQQATIKRLEGQVGDLARAYFAACAESWDRRETIERERKLVETYLDQIGEQKTTIKRYGEALKNVRRDLLDAVEVERPIPLDTCQALADEATAALESKGESDAGNTS
jgi:hypothetical protein